MSFWVNKKVLVTGATGFIGNYLYERLDALGASVYGISKTKKKKNIYKIDITNFFQVNKLIHDKKIQICFHLAGESLVENGQKDPYHTFKTNIEGALNILESARLNKLEKIIIASTSHVYGDNKPPYLEGLSPKPSRPYETSKTCTDLIAQSYANTYFLPVLIPRFVNTYGPGDLNFSRLIPKTIKSVLSNKSPLMWGGGAKRDYLYVDDVVRAYLILGEANMSKIGRNRVFNFGSNNTFSVEELIEKIILLSGRKFKITQIKDARSFEIKSQYSSWEKARKLFKWEPKYSIDQGLQETIEWYEEYFKKNKQI